MDPKPTLLIVGYNNLADGFRTCANYLEKDYEVLFFPLLRYQHLGLSAVHDLPKYINGRRLPNYVEGLVPNSKKIDVVFIWYLNYFTQSWSRLDDFILLKRDCHACAKFIGYSWDPLIPPVIKDEINPIRCQLIGLLYAYIGGDGRELRHLRPSGFDHVYYGPSGFDPNVTYPQPNPELDSPYRCDISIVCTNLYGDPKQFPLECVRLNRKRLIDLIYEHRTDFVFHVYGPEFLGALYPDCYKGYIPYTECPKVFSNSRINLCIHAVSYNNDIESDGESLYFSERLPQILGSRGLLYCETDYSPSTLLRPGHNYVLADPEDPISQLRNILDHYEEETYQRIIEEGHALAQKYLTWNTLRQRLKAI